MTTTAAATTTTIHISISF